MSSAPPAGALSSAGSAPRDSAAPPMLRLDGLTRRFGPAEDASIRPAVDGLSFTVLRGELFGLVGPDGAGKTTTLRMLAGVLPPTAGDAEVDGVSVARRPEEVKRHLAYMSQRFGLYTDLTVAENIDFYADLYSVPRSELPARLARLYEFSGLAPFQRRLAGQLSGGMKQKLGLSCALVHEPALLLLDEPTFGVDPVSRRELWRIVHERVAEGVTAVVSTAYLDEAERFDRVALLHQGRLLALDTPSALQRSLPERMLEARVDDPRRAAALLRERGLVRRATAYGARLHLALDPATGDAPAIATALREAGLEVDSLEPVPPSLEDVFIALVEAETESRTG